MAASSDPLEVPDNPFRWDINHDLPFLKFLFIPESLKAAAMCV
jgi:hypothetical protein